MGNNRVVIPKLQYVYIHTKDNSHVGNKHPVKRPLSDFFTKYTSIFTRPFYLIISSAMTKTDKSNQKQSFIGIKVVRPKEPEPSNYLGVSDLF